MSHPWFILGIVAALFGCFLTGYMRGQASERKVWELIIAQQKIEAGALLAKSEHARAEISRAYAALKDRVEMSHADAEARVKKAYAANRALLARFGGLRDKQGAVGRACRTDFLPGDPAAAGGTAAPASGCRLSEETSQALLDLARDADRVAAYAAACHHWAVNLEKIKVRPAE